MEDEAIIDENAKTGLRPSWDDQFGFQYPLRRYQQDIIDLCNKKLAAGEKALHIVAPPGSGKTIIGLQIVSQFKCPTLVVCPNTTIQSQWAQKLNLFFPADYSDTIVGKMIGSHEERPLRPLTIVTYQALSVPGREQEYVNEIAMNSWLGEIAREQALTWDDAKKRVCDLKSNNSKAYKKDLSRHATRMRKRLFDSLDLNQVLHKNALQLVAELKGAGCQLVIFDECHHLTDYWAAVMAKVIDELDEPVVVGLTGTPPEKKSAAQQNRYLKLVGEIDYQVPTPALVKEGGLAPFQDLVFFTEPTEKELDFLRRQHEEIHELISSSTSPLSDWIVARMASEVERGWAGFVEDSPGLALAMARFLYTNNLSLPPDLEFSMSVRQAPVIDDWICLIEDFALQKLKTSESPEDHELLERFSKACRKIGFGLSERGIRKIASPVDRVLSFSQSKVAAIARILDVEFSSLEDKLRALVITDFEKLSATTVASVKDVLDEDAGSAFGAFADLLKLPEGALVNPVLVTGNRVLVDARIAQDFLLAAQNYLNEQQLDLLLLLEEDASMGFARVTSNSGAFSPRVYVGLVTVLFERGLTKCLIGTRGIFGEGWDSQKLNTIIDLTTATSPVSVKQLRGRGIRLNVDDPLAERKVTNIWDVICIAPELEKGLNDYRRFVRKHEGYFGIADDGRIECGVGHVHPSFSDLTANEVFASINDFNQEMLQRALVRDKIYELWKIGKPYENRQLGCVEISRLTAPGVMAPYVRRLPGEVRSYSSREGHARQMRAELTGVWTKWGALGLAVSTGAAAASLPLILAVVPIILGLITAKLQAEKREKQMELQLCEPSSEDSLIIAIGTAVLQALKERKLVPQNTSHSSIHVTARADKTFRVLLDDVETRYSDLFVRCLEEVLAPVSNQPYVVPRYEFITGGEGFLKRYLSGQTQTEVSTYHALPKILARSEKGREAFEAAWNEHVSPGFVTLAAENPEIMQKYFGVGPSLAERLLWE